jgi:MFS family permease
MTLGYDLFNSTRKQKLLLVTGGILHVCSIYSGSQQKNFVVFIILYAILGGIGSGMLIMLPMKCSSSYCPDRRPLLTLIFLSSGFLSAMVGCLVSTMIINSQNRRPNIIVSNGKMREKFYQSKSLEV